MLPSQSFRYVWTATVVVTLAMSACASGADSLPVQAAEHSDSAGVEIVLNSTAASVAPVFAVLDTTPSLRLGSLDGRPEEQFGRVAGVEPLADGGVAVLDGQAAEIRLFGPDGAYRATLGSKGGGPGEFQSPIMLSLLPGDTLAVFDAGPRRITLFGPDGALGRITTLQDTRARIIAAGFLSDGRLVGQSRWLSTGGGPLPGREATFARDTSVLTLFAADGGVQDTIDVVPGREFVTRIDMSEGSISVFRRLAALPRSNVFTVHPDGVWSSTNDRFELRLRETTTGRLLRIVRAPGLDMPVTDGLIQTIRSRALAEAETAEDRRQVETWFSLSPRPQWRPAYDLLIVDPNRRLWVRTWSMLDLATRWWVFDAGGDLLGSVDVPGGLEITSVRCGWVWGLMHDELGVGYVVRYPFRGADICG